MVTIAEFPYISDDEFISACHQLQDSCECSVLTDDTKALTLRFTRTVSSHDNISHTRSSEVWEAEDCVDEMDGGALVTSTETTSIILLYDIMLSPSYRVPVVYLQLKTGAMSCQMPDVEQLHDMVVPDSHRSAIEATGVYGALSMTVPCRLFMAGVQAHRSSLLMLDCRTIQ